MSICTGHNKSTTFSLTFYVFSCDESLIFTGLLLDIEEALVKQMLFSHGFNHSVTVQTIPSLKAVMEGSDQVRIERTYMVDYICTYKGVQI